MSDKIEQEYVIIPKGINDIISELNLEEDEKELCKSIITDIEKEASDAIRAMKVVNIPFIGCIRINPVKRQIRDNYKNFRLARQRMNKDQYKEHVRSYVNDLREEQEEKDFIKLVIKKIRSHNKNKYKDYCSKINKSYAEMFIYSIYLLNEVPFDIEFERMYQSLND